MDLEISLPCSQYNTKKQLKCAY